MQVLGRQVFWRVEFVGHSEGVTNEGAKDSAVCSVFGKRHLLDEGTVWLRCLAATNAVCDVEIVVLYLGDYFSVCSLLGLNLHLIDLPPIHIQ